MTALSNAERQSRWRENLRDKAAIIDGTAKEIAEALLLHLSKTKARKIVRELDKRLKAIKADCESCKGTGYVPIQFSTACGTPIFGQSRWPCDCGPEAAARIRSAERQKRRTTCEVEQE